MLTCFGGRSRRIAVGVVITGARQDRETGVFGEAWIGLAELAEQKGRAFARLDFLGVAALLAETGGG